MARALYTLLESEVNPFGRLGPDPFRPHDNIMAGVAYMRWLKGKYGYPALFAAYNAGPQRVDDLLAHGTVLPASCTPHEWSAISLAFSITSSGRSEYWRPTANCASCLVYSTLNFPGPVGWVGDPPS